LVGAAVITRWSYGLLRNTSGILLDAIADQEGTSTAIKRELEGHADNRVADLHVWPVGPNHCSAMYLW
jgi:Co/Zn/Cd efflux system component